MKTRMFSPLLLVAWWCFISGCRAQEGILTSRASSSSSSSPLSDDIDVSRLVARLPACGTTCLDMYLSETSCTNTSSCICSDQPFMDQVDGCIKSSCDFAQQIVAKNVTETTCGRPPRDRSAQYNTTSIVLCVVTGTLVILRLIFKQFFGEQKRLRLDDWFILLSVIVGLPCTILNTTGLTANGLGKDVWAVDSADLVEFARFFFIQQFLYLFLMCTIKLSLICFYLVIFPTRTVRLVLWSTFALNVVWGFVCIIVTVFQCTPVQDYWLRYLHGRGRCLNMNMLGWANGAVSVAIDLWIIGIPLSQLRRLDLHWKKKIGVAIMFLTGAFVTIVSILRLQSLLYFYSSSNPTWDLWPTAWWSTIEINIGLICACLPTIRLLLMRVCPGAFGSPMPSAHYRGSSWGDNMMMVRHQLPFRTFEDEDEDRPPTPPPKDDIWLVPRPPPSIGRLPRTRDPSRSSDDTWEKDKDFCPAKGAR